MSTPIAPEQSEVLLRVIEAAPQVCRRHQFFVWSQGDFQRWLPHKLSVCGSYDRDQRDLVFDIFNSLPVPEHVLAGLRDARSDLMRMAINNWHRCRRQACTLPLSAFNGTNKLASTLAELGYGEFLVHGIHRPGRPEELESFFLFGLPSAPYPEDTLRAFEMLLPSLHVAYQRVYATERQMMLGRSSQAAMAGQPVQRSTPITEREREILLWVRDGLSNQQISEKLGISALTVKNHVQKILRKLGAANRAQAVAKAMTLHSLGAVQSMPDPSQD
jgi:transcriptional regulator EpsA